MTLLLK